MADRVIIYGKAGWPYTDKAREAYKDHTYVNVKEDKEKLDEMLKLSNGVRKVPVILDGESVSVGYGGSWGVWSNGAGRPRTNPITTEKTWYFNAGLLSEMNCSGQKEPGRVRQESCGYEV